MDHPAESSASEGEQTTADASAQAGEPASRAAPIDHGSPWAPLSVPIFRAFWLASLVSNLGTWVHEVGAGWLMTSLDSSPEMVSAVRVALTAPTMLLAIPAGVLADRLDRRRLLILTQIGLLSTTSMLSALTLAGAITSWSLLALTFVIGLGMVLHILTWQSTVPMLVPRPQLSRAVALGSMSFNLARATGPALGGVLIALAGVWIAFAVNAMSFAGVLLVLLSWHGDQRSPSAESSYRDALLRGIRHALAQRTMKNVLISLSLFGLPSAAFWSLVPLLAKEQLHWESRGYGLLVTMIGCGAVTAARYLHWMQRQLGLDRTIAGSMSVFALGILLLGTTTYGPLALAACFVMGGAWMMTLTTLNATALMTLHNELRARGMGCYMTVMAFSMSAGSLLWGRVAGACGLTNTLWIAAGTLLVAAAIRTKFPLQSAPTDVDADESSEA